MAIPPHIEATTMRLLNGTKIRHKSGAVETLNWVLIQNNRAHTPTFLGQVLGIFRRRKFNSRKWGASVSRSKAHTKTTTKNEVNKYFSFFFYEFCLLFTVCVITAPPLNKYWTAHDSQLVANTLRRRRRCRYYAAQRRLLTNTRNI